MSAQVTHSIAFIIAWTASIYYRPQPGLWRLHGGWSPVQSYTLSGNNQPIQAGISMEAGEGPICLHENQSITL